MSIVCDYLPICEIAINLWYINVRRRKNIIIYNKEFIENLKHFVLKTAFKS